MRRRSNDSRKRATSSRPPLTAASAADASALQTTLVGYLGLARGMAGSAGLPPAIFDDVSIRERGADVSVALDLSYQDLRAAAAIP